MLKLIYRVCLLYVLMISLIGCSNNANDVTGEIEQIEYEEKNEYTQENKKEINMSLKTTELRSVYNFYDSYYLVFDYDEEEKVIAEYYYYYFDDAVEAKDYADYIQNEYDKEEYVSVQNVENYVIYELHPNTYGELTKTEVMDTYSFLEEM